MEHFPPKKILVPVDFSDCSLAGIKTAQRLAGAWNSSLEAVHVDENLLGRFDLSSMSGVLRGTLQEYYRELEARLRGLLQASPEAQARVLSGEVKMTLAGLLRKEEADLIVMGTHGRSGVGRFLLGSVAEAVIRSSDRTPVLAVHTQPPRVWPVRVLVPLNLAAYADGALLYACELARSLKASLSVLHVLEKEEGALATSELLEEHLKELLGESRAKGVYKILDKGEAAECILRTTEANSFDLIVMAAHRKSFWKTWRFGTTAERVLRYSPVPVLCVPSGKLAMDFGDEKRETRILETTS